MPKFGFHPAIWQCGTDLERFWQAVEAIAGAGWDGFEVAGPILEPYYDKPEEFTKRVAEHGIALATVYSGYSFADADHMTHELAHLTRIADFCQAVGCQALLIDGGTKLIGQHHGEPDYQRVAVGANLMGEIARERGLTCAWHQHWGTMFEFPPAFHRLMALTDPNLVKFCPDTAQLTLGQFDVAEVFAEYLDRIVYVHFKDLGAERGFVELGEGTIDFRPVWYLLQSIHYDGWIVVDLDYTRLDPGESCRLNRECLAGICSIDEA